jgi:hypothetical protein
MSQRVIISRAHRDALYGELLTSLNEADDLLRLGRARDPEDLEACERIGRRMADALRLIQDGGIGWGFRDEEEPCELKLPSEELRRIMEAQRGTMAALVESERAQREELEGRWRQTTEAREACSSVLDQLGGR